MYIYTYMYTHVCIYMHIGICIFVSYPVLEAVHPILGAGQHGRVGEYESAVQLYDQQHQHEQSQG
jgi:hypothetical protein